MAKRILTALMLVVAAGGSSAANVIVNCGGGGEEAFTSISAALARLNPRESNTATVYGACNENLFIQNFSALTLNAASGASISDASGGTKFVILIDHSPHVIISGFTINGAVQCQLVSNCDFNGNSFKDSLRSGVEIFGAATALFSGDTISNAKAVGLLVDADAGCGASQLTVTGSTAAGVRVQEHSYLNISNSTLQGNGTFGIRVIDHSTVNSAANTITGNALSGVSLESGSEGLFAANVITGNGGNGVRVADLSFANFPSPGNNNISGNTGQPDVVCLPQFSATRGALTNIGAGGTTTCKEP